MFRSYWFTLRSKFFRTVIVPKKLKDVEHNYTGKKKKYTNTLKITHCVEFSSLRDLLRGVRLQHISMGDENILSPPESVRGMTVLDQSKFNKTISIQTLCVQNGRLKEALKFTKGHRLKLSKQSPVVDLEKSDPRMKTHRLILLNPETFSSYDSFTKQEKDNLEKLGISENNIITHALKLSFDNWTFHDISKAILPNDIETVSGFSQVGHIAHFNLREDVLPFKNILGEVLIMKTPAISTVVNKLNSIDNTYRNFQMELLAGEENYITQTKENGCTFELDFSKVYWNSRLGTEHFRIVDLITNHDVVIDVFAGIGPFAVPASKKGATVFANDLNPASFESLKKNVKLNKVKGDIQCFNMDGREFITTVVKSELQKMYETNTDKLLPDTKIYILMNLPAMAVSFLDAFKLLLKDVKITKDAPLPIVNCYCFSDYSEADKTWKGDMDMEIGHRVMNVIGGLSEEDVSVRYVRDVAPNKDMKCVTFKLTHEILTGTEADCAGTEHLGDRGTKTDRERDQAADDEEPPRKCLKSGD